MKFTKEHHRVMESMENRISQLENLFDRVQKLEYESVTYVRSGEETRLDMAFSHRVSVRYLVWLILDHLGLKPVHVEVSTKLVKKPKTSEEN